MCFDVAKNVTQYTADTDITCYKQVDNYTNNLCRSTCTDFKYKYGKVYSLRNTAVLNLFQLRSTIYYKHAKRNILYNLCNNLKVHRNQIHSGFHSYMHQRSCNVECIIPAGSKYYMDDIEYVSNKIKIVKQIA